MSRYELTDLVERLNAALKKLVECKTQESILIAIRAEAKEISINPVFGVMNGERTNPKFPGSLFCLEPEYLVEQMSIRGFKERKSEEIKNELEMAIRNSSARMVVTFYQRIARDHEEKKDELITLYPAFFANFMAKMAVRSQCEPKDRWNELILQEKRGRGKTLAFNHEDSKISLEKIGFNREEIRELLRPYSLLRVTLIEKVLLEENERKARELAQEKAMIHEKAATA